MWMASDFLDHDSNTFLVIDVVVFNVGMIL